MSTPNLTNLFEESCDPHGYIPRRASEEVLRCLSSLIRDGEPAVVLHGPAGMGKSMLLHVLRERFADERRVAYLSLTDGSQADIARRLVGLLEEPTTDDPKQGLINAAASASDGRPRLLLLIDHPNLAPVASSLQLAKVAEAASPHLTAIFAIADEDGAVEFSRALSAQSRVTTVSFDEPMDGEEATAYVRLRLARTQIPAALSERLDDRAMRWLSDGARAPSPREINRRATELLANFEEDGEVAFSATPPSGGPRAVAPSDIPRPDRLEPSPPSFPMSPETGGQAPAATGGGGSLGGMLLGHGAGPTKNLEFDLELGRSLSSGLLESASVKKSSKDGQPVEAQVAAPVTAEGSAKPTTANVRPKRSHSVIAVGVFLAVLIATAVLTQRNAEEKQRVDEAASQAVALQEAREQRELEARAEAAAEKLALAKAPVRDAPDRARPSIVNSAMLERVVQEMQNEKLLEEQREERIEATRIEAELLAAARPAPIVPPQRSQPKTNAPIVLPTRLSPGDEAVPASYILLSIDVEAGAVIEVDGKPIGTAPLADIFVEIGSHTFVAEMPDGIRVEQLVDVQAGTNVIEF